MADITEHDSKEEGKRDNDRDGRVDLLVRGRSIGVDDGLESIGKLVRADVGRRRLVSSNLVDNRRNRKTSAVRHILKRGPDAWEVRGGTPTLSDKRSPGSVVREEVKRAVHRLLLGHKDHPYRQGLGNLVELDVERRLRVLQHVLDVGKASIDLVNLIPTKIAVLINAINIGTHRLRDLSNLGKNFLAVGKDDENILVDGLVGGRVNEGFGNLGLVHVKITAQSSPKNPLKSINAVSGNNTSNESDVHPRKGSLGIGSTSVCLDILQKRSLITLRRSADLLDVSMGTVEEAAGLAEHPSPFGKIDLAFLERLVAFIQLLDALLKDLASLHDFVNVGRGQSSEVIAFGVKVELAEGDFRFFHLRMEVP